MGIVFCKFKNFLGVGLVVFKLKDLRRLLINYFCLELEKECRKFVRKKTLVLKCIFFEDLRKFKWLKLIKEWVYEVFILYKVFRVIVVLL